MIWGLTLEPGCIYTRTVTTETHLSLATLDCRGKVFAGTDPVKVSHVVLKTSDCEQLLCSLVQGLVLQQQLDLKVMPNEEVAFSNQGNCSVYITGYSIEAEYNYKLVNSPAGRSAVENHTSTYEVHTEWEMEEDFRETGQEDTELAAEILTEIREEQHGSSAAIVVADADEEQSLTNSSSKLAVASEETVCYQDDGNVFCIAVKEEPEDGDDNAPPIVPSTDNPQRGRAVPETQHPRDDVFHASLTANVTAANVTPANVEDGNVDSVHPESSVSETLSPASLGSRIDNLQRVTATGKQTVSCVNKDVHPACRQGKLQMTNCNSNCPQNQQTASSKQNVSKLSHHSGDEQCIQRKSRTADAAPKSMSTRTQRKLSTSQAAATLSKRPQRPPTVAEMISKVGHKEFEAVHHQFSERRGEISDPQESRLEVLTCSPGELRMEFPLYDSAGRGSRFQCRYCSKTLNCRRSLIHHEMIHTGDKPFSCRFCHKSFIQKSQWKVHERIHTGVKPFVCKLCGKAFSRLYNKRMHAKTCKNHNTLNIVQREKTPD